MKVMFALLLAAALILTGCGKTQPVPEQPEPTPRLSLQEMADRLAVRFGLDLPAALDKQMLQDLLELEEEDLEEYAGQISMSMVSADNLIFLRPKPDSFKKAQKALSKRLEYVRLAFENYLPDQYEKARAGSVTTRGGYLFLVVVGRSDTDPVEEAALAQQMIDSFFEGEKSGNPVSVAP